jgi:hypothetical protein
MGAGVDEGVVDDEVAALGEGRKERGVGRIAAREEERRLGAEEARGLLLQRLMLLMVAAQQPRAARAERHAACQRIGHRIGERRRRGERQIVVGGEIEAGARDEPPAATLERKPFQVADMRFKQEHRRRP